MNKTLFTLLALTVIGVCASSFYTYIYKKDYDLRVQTSCDPQEHTCFMSGCEGSDCESGQLYSRIFIIHAADYGACKDGSCLGECESGAIACREIACASDSEDTCSSQHI